MASIWAVCKDPGGTGNLLPILPLLRKAGHDVKLFLHAGGKGETGIKTAGEAYETASNTSAPIDRHGYPDLLVTTMCSGGGIGRDLVPTLQYRGKRTVALQDFWGAQLGTNFRNPLYHPDLICVNDEVGADIVRDVWGKDIRTKIAITGYPSFDALARIDREAGAKRGREVLGITNNLPILLYPGQIWHAGRTLLEVVKALNEMGLPCHLVATKHGRMVEAPAEEGEFWQEAEGSFRWKFHSVTDFRHIREIVLTSRVVVGMYSSLQIEAAALGVQVISVLYPDQGAAQFRTDTGGVMAEFPLVTLGCSAKAENMGDLVRSLFAYLTLTSDLEPRTRQQQKVFPLDGRNAERTADAILSLL